jgi:hypothetical protein
MDRESFMQRKNFFAAPRRSCAARSENKKAGIAPAFFLMA